MQSKDIISMEYFQNPARFADLLNGFLFQGEQVVRPEDVVEADRSISGRMQAEGKTKPYQLFRDIFRRVQCRMQVMLVAIENQSGIHYAMPVRVLNAEGAAYAGQLKTKEKLHREQKDLSGLPSGFSQMVRDYPINLLEIRKYPHLEQFQTDIRYVFGFLQNVEDKEKLASYVEENREILSKLDEEAYDLISVMSKTSQLKQLKRTCQREEGGTDMCKAIDDMIEDGRKEGRLDGERQGIILTKQVFKLERQGKSLQEIADTCAVPVEKVQMILE